MSFEIAIRALLALLVLVSLARAARSLRRGWVDLDGEAYPRESEPRIFWVDVALELLVALLAGWAAAFGSLESSWPIVGALVVPATVRFLITRRRRARPRIFSQGAGEYLALASLYGLLVLAAIGLFFLFVRGL